jgi:hypothetical protein
VGDWIQRHTVTRLLEEGKRETELLLEDPTDSVPRPVSVECDRGGLAARHLYERWARGRSGELGKTAAQAET